MKNVNALMIALITEIVSITENVNATSDSLVTIALLPDALVTAAPLTERVITLLENVSVKKASKEFSVKEESVRITALDMVNALLMENVSVILTSWERTAQV